MPIVLHVSGCTIVKNWGCCENVSAWSESSELSIRGLAGSINTDRLSRACDLLESESRRKTLVQIYLKYNTCIMSSVTVDWMAKR